jgi:hypothetical protein
MKPARRARNGFDSRYLVYLNNRAAGKGSVKTIDLCDQKTAPLTPKSFIYNRRSYSQAGRRGFDPRLPLQSFNNLADSTRKHFTSFTSKTRIYSFSCNASSSVVTACRRLSLSRSLCTCQSQRRLRVTSGPLPPLDRRPLCGRDQHGFSVNTWKFTHPSLTFSSLP